ncbi:MAG TPA: glycosyltransferase [Magnetospirillaceae bacterium]|nr:glycosyltransferase [Magnetospirillaceae bacterium]
MKIAHITLYPPRGAKHVEGSGVISYSKNLVASMVGQGHDVSVLCDIQGQPESYTEDGATIYRCFSRTNGGMVQLHKQLKKLRPDIIHIQQELALFGGISTAYLLQWLVFAWRKKTVVTLHGVVDPTTIDTQFVRENNANLPVPLVKAAFHIIYGPLARWAKHIIVHDQYFKDILVRHYGIPSQKVSVVPHGIEDLKPLPTKITRKRLALPPNAHVALFMGYATGYKGIDLLIEGFALYAKTDKDAFLLLGAGPHPKLHNDARYQAEYARLQQKAKKSIPSSQYRWVGFIPENDIRQYYSAADVSLSPYTTALASSGPMSIAIGYEKPFLASAAFKEVFATTPELLFERTPQALATKLTAFFNAPTTYQIISRELKAQQIWPSIGTRTLDVYSQMDTA